MTTEEKTFFEGLMNQMLDLQYVKTGIHFSKLEAAHDITNIKLTEGVIPKLHEIEKKVDKTNGRVTELEKKEVEHVITCPQGPKIRKLEDESLTHKSVKKWIVGSVGISAGVVSTIYILFQLFIK